MKEEKLMNSNLRSVVLALLGTLVFFLLIIFIGGAINPSLKLDQTALLRFVFVVIGLLIVLAVYWVTRDNKMWAVGTREVVYMSIGAALYAIFSYLFNGTVFVVPSLSQVSLRPAIAIPMFFGYAFGPVVGFFTGAVGNMFGDALTGFGLSPQWSVGNGLVGMIAGMVYLFSDKKRSMDTVLIISGVLAVLATALFFLNRNNPNMLFFDPGNNIFGDQQISLFAGISSLVGLVLVLVVRFLFNQNIDVAAAVTWSMLGNFLGLGFAAISDIWINGFSPAAAIVGEFLPAAGPNLLFAAILVPILVGAYAAVQRQSGR
jgi:energy-coupling factor transport system substrate-specific component